jgi:dihydrofolate reductase
VRKLYVFNNISLDGYFTDKNGDMSWAHRPDAEFNEFTQNNAKGGGVLLFGRVTYDLMIKFWPTPMAMQSNPIVAERINGAEKIVFSNTMDKASWNNTKIVKGDIVAAMRKLKEQPGDNMVIMGSGSLVSQFTEAGLIDEFQFVLCPIILGTGRTLFERVTTRPILKRTDSRSFKNGNMFLRYEPEQAQSGP